jgi:BirA family biotin operon repressor/biotin-[acetyl-CoA-carboxylase] ligase
VIGRDGSHTAERDWFGLDLFRPGPRFLRDGAHLYLLDEVGSTNAFLRGRGEAARGRLCVWDGWGWQAPAKETLAPVREPHPGTVVVARRQTAGRGRQGRVWLDCGGLNLSVVVPGHRAAFERGFSVWLGLQTVLVLREGDHLDARLKWPNDIVVGQRKLGGILLETTGSGDDARVVAGLGLNLETDSNGFPPGLQGHATSVRLERGRAPRPGDLAGRILTRVEAALDDFGRLGWSPFRPALACLDALLGQTVDLVTAKGPVRGRAVGVDDQGRLLLEDDDGRVRPYRGGDAHLAPVRRGGGEA